ncbi:MAG: tRNA preQ1(34) S-adenosylmethionine ribosyltransferase-isomerase QueA [Clostridiales bacterium]|nr:tRNA preQ1(34) S-adenosylmethionine ribosyltransferase-isomerase QueA [Clostridiales bacterium]
MKKDLFNFDLPQELIAQHPLQNRSASRLMVLDRKSNRISHKIFEDLKNILKAGDCLVLNDSRVLPARIYGENILSGARVEFLLLNEKRKDEWECLAGPGRKAKKGSEFVFGKGELKASVKSVEENGNRILSFEYEGKFLELLGKIGQMPLPPYIKEELKDAERYQTVYSKQIGSSAAPTAGLHFTNELLSNLSDLGIKIAYITLHVGLGTFRPVKSDNIREHKMHSEYYSINEEAADLINDTKAKGGCVVAVGTTACRSLEAVADERGKIKAQEGQTDIFIYPGYKFKCVDALITNFHLPESTLLMLVSAFYGRENILEAYKKAVEEKYRFFSFGDAMFIG